MSVIKSKRGESVIQFLETSIHDLEVSYDDDDDDDDEDDWVELEDEEEEEIYDGDIFKERGL